VCNFEPITKKRNPLGEKIPLLQRCPSSCQQSELGGKSLHDFYCAVLGIVANVVSLIDSLGGAVRTVSNKKKQYISHYQKNMTPLFHWTGKMVRKWKNLQEISISRERRWLQLWKIKKKGFS